MRHGRIDALLMWSIVGSVAIAAHATEPMQGTRAADGLVAKAQASTTAWADEEPMVAISEEIMVTARKLEDRAWELPPSVTAMTAAELRGPDPRTISDIAAQVPSLEITSGFSAANPMIFLRGVGIPDFNANASGVVGVYSDEVYMASPAGPVLSLFDISNGSRSCVVRKGLSMVATRPVGRSIS